MKSYNLQGDQSAGKVLVGNWEEERQWKDNISAVQRTNHGNELITSSDEFEGKSVYMDTFTTPPASHKKLPPREAMRMREMRNTISRDIQTEALEQEDNKMYFTRGRYLNQEETSYDGPIDYINDEPITFYTATAASSGKKGFGRNSKFTEPIEDYTGDQIVKDL